jgi:hypothetical protein
MKVKIDKDIKDWITMWSLSRNETFEETLNWLLRSKMTDDTAEYMAEIDELFK